MNEETNATPAPGNDAPAAETPPTTPPTADPSAVESPSSVPPPAGETPSETRSCPPAKPFKPSLVVGVVAILLAILVSFFGCGKSPAKQSLAQTRQFTENFGAGRVDLIFAQLPKTTRDDMRETVQLVAETFGEKFFNELDGLGKEISRFIDKNRKQIYALLKEQGDGEAKKWLEKDDISLCADLIEDLSSKLTYDRLSRGDIEGVLEIGNLHKALARILSLRPVAGGLADIEIQSVEIEDEDEEDMPVILVESSFMTHEWDSEVFEVKEVRKTETLAIGFVDEDGTWFPAWCAPARDKDARRLAMKNKSEWMAALIRKGNGEIQQVLGRGRAYSDEIADLTFDIAQLRKDIKRWNDRKPRKDETLEAFLESLESDIDAIGRDLERLDRAMSRASSPYGY